MCITLSLWLLTFTRQLYEFSLFLSLFLSYFSFVQTSSPSSSSFSSTTPIIIPSSSSSLSPPTTTAATTTTAAHDHANPLKRELGVWDLTSIGVGGIIGAGIYVLTGKAAALYAGPSIVLSYLLSGIACTFSALCYAELASMIPAAGSAYAFATATLGQFVGWIIGWDLMLEYLFGAATVAVGWSGYFCSY
jgi:amino acid permease